MTRKDYVLLADVMHSCITSSRSEQERDILNMVIVRIAIVLGEGNPRFDGERFINACWMPEARQVSTETNTTTKEGK